MKRTTRRKRLIFNYKKKFIMSKLSQLLKQSKDHAWQALKDTVFPRALRRHRNRNMYNTKNYYPFNPGYANDYVKRPSESVEHDYRTPFKDSKREQIRYEEGYFRKQDSEYELATYTDNTKKLDG